MRFDSYHPLINLLYFSAVLACTVLFRQPCFVAVSFLCAFLYSVKLCGKRAWIVNAVLTVLIAPWAGWYSYYNHFGITPLKQNFIGNRITLESLVYGIVLGFVIVSVIMWFECIHEVMSADKWIYLLGRISPKLSLFVSILLRTVPRIRARAKKVNTARYAIGRGTGQGNILQRIVNVFRQISILVTWLTENFVEVSDSMRCRGYTLRGRSAFSIYRFDNRDRAFVTELFFCLTAVLMAVLLDQVNIQYDPEILMNRITAVSFVFYFLYALFCLMPFILQIFGEVRFARLRKETGEAEPY